VGEQFVAKGGNARELLFPDHDGASSLPEESRVQRLVVGGGVRVGDEDRRRPGRGELPYRAARARESEVGDREGFTEMVGGREQHVVRTLHARAQRCVVTLPGDMENGRPLLRVGRHRELVERGRTSEAAEDREDGLVAREAEASPALVSARSEMGLRY